MRESLMRLPLRLRSPREPAIRRAAFCRGSAGRCAPAGYGGAGLRTTLDLDLAARARTAGEKPYRARQRPRHAQCGRAAGRHARSGHQGPGRFGRLFRQDDFRAGQRRARQALAGLGAQAVRSMRSASIRACCIRRPCCATCRPHLVRSRRRISTDVFSVRSPRPKRSMRSRNIPGSLRRVEVEKSRFLSVPQGRRHQPHGGRGLLRPCARARRRRSDDGGARQALCDTGQSRHARAAASSRRRTTRARRARVQRGGELHGARHAAPESAPGRCRDRAATAGCPCTGKPAPRGAFATRGRRASSGPTCSWSGSAISTAAAIPRSSASRRRRRCSSISSTPCARVIRR